MRNKPKSNSSEEKKTYSKGRSKKYSKKNASKRDNPAELEKGNRDNDPNYYFVSKEIAEQASQISFQNFLGFGDLEGYRVPTIAIVEDVMNPGTTELVRTARSLGAIEGIAGASTTNLTPKLSGKTGVNLMASKLYTLLGVWSGRITQYQPNDVAMMILTISGIAELSEHIRRFFGLLLTYNFRNRMLPLNLIRVLGCDPDDLKDNIGDYRMRFNVAMSRINKIPLLDNIGFIRKSRERYQRVYMDDPTNMGQLFAYVPKYYFELDEAGDTDGSILRAHELRPSNLSGERTMDDLLTYLENMITVAIESSTLNLVYADILTMASKISVPMWQFDYLAENYIVMPEYNQNALLQFHNLTVMGTPGYPADATWNTSKHQYTDGSGVKYWFTGGADVFCDVNNNNIVYSPVFRIDKALCKWFIDMPTDNPSLEDKIEAMANISLCSGSRITNTDLGITASSMFSVLNALTDHYVADILIFDNIADRAQADVMDISIYTAQPNYPSCEFTQFEHAPNYVTGSYTFTKMYGSLQYFTDVDFAFMRRYRDSVSIGLWEFRT